LVSKTPGASPDIFIDERAGERLPHPDPTGTERHPRSGLRRLRHLERQLNDRSIGKVNGLIGLEMAGQDASQQMTFRDVLFGVWTEYYSRPRTG
jgi:hypothetical protein